LPTPPLDPETHKLIYVYGKQKLSISQIRRVLRDKHGIRVAVGTVFNWKNVPPPGLRVAGIGIKADKKTGETDWREMAAHLRTGQELRHKWSDSQDHATVELGDGTHPVALGTFSDQHIGSWGCNYDLLEQLTDEVVNTPRFYIGMLGDEGQYSIKLRSVIEVSDNQLPPEYQTKFIESWFDYIWKKVAFATWDNHGVERQEQLSGESSLKRTKSKRVVYFNGIGHVDLVVGGQIYRGAVSHVFRGRSMLNPCHAIMRYMRFEGIDREWGMMGDSHVPGMIKYADGAKVRIAVNGGSLQNNSGYAKRYFSLTTHPTYPVIVFRHDRHEMVPFWSLKEALDCGALK
jgi:hypothetical protein